jgi:hypothetical protein
MPIAINKRSLALAVIVASASTFGHAEQATVQSLADMVKQGDVNFNFRYRYEYVDQDGFDEEANASTLRSRLTFASASYKGLSFLTEVDNVADIGDDDFNSTDNGKTEYPVVADPDGTDINQASLKYSREKLSGTFGRQRILHGNQRFVGGVAWRQNEQTYDGFRGNWSSDFGLSADIAYVYTVNRIFGPDDSDAQPAQWDGDNYLVRLDYKFLENHSLAGFAYILDIDERERWSPNKSVNNSTDTYGLHYSGKFGPLAASAAFATQEDGGDSFQDYDASYYMLEAGATFFGVNGKVGYEVLEGDNGVGFKTPLATLHKFQGWADKFLITPGDGIEDIYVGFSGKIGPVKLGATWHDFQAEDSSADFGSEIDLVATWPVNKMLSLQLKYADFDSDDDTRYQDTKKAWMTVNLKL